MEKSNDTISFRLAPEFLKLLNEEALKEGKSPGASARRILVRALSDTERTEIRAELEKVQKDLRKLRGDLATLTWHLFVKVGKMRDDEAKTLAKEILAP